MVLFIFIVWLFLLLLQYAIDYDPLVLKKYADVANQSADDLIDGITKSQEEKFDYSFYNGKQFDQGNWVGGEGFICPSDVKYARPLRAKNADGEWRVIVQDNVWPNYPQTQRVETCLFPEAACRTLAPCHHSKCLQKYVYHRMLSFDPCDSYKGVFIDTYKLPSACSCHIGKWICLKFSMTFLMYVMWKYRIYTTANCQLLLVLADPQ